MSSNSASEEENLKDNAPASKEDSGKQRSHSSSRHKKHKHKSKKSHHKHKHHKDNKDGHRRHKHKHKKHKSKKEEEPPAATPVADESESDIELEDTIPLPKFEPKIPPAPPQPNSRRDSGRKERGRGGDDTLAALEKQKELLQAQLLATAEDEHSGMNLIAQGYQSDEEDGEDDESALKQSLSKWIRPEGTSKPSSKLESKDSERSEKRKREREDETSQKKQHRSKSPATERSSGSSRVDNGDAKSTQSRTNRDSHIHVASDRKHSKDSDSRRDSRKFSPSATKSEQRESRDSREPRDGRKSSGRDGRASPKRELKSGEKSKREISRDSKPIRSRSPKKER